MSLDRSSAFAHSVRWLALYAGFPAGRLPPKAELLVLFAAAAQEEDDAVQAKRFLIERRNVAMDASQRAHAMNRSLAHYVCNNGQKV